MTPPKEGIALSLEKLKACIHCGFCLPACPTYRETGSEAESPRGRLYLMRKLLGDAAKPAAVEPVQVLPHLDQCLGCQACQTVCPSGVEYGSLLFEARQALAPHQPRVKRFLKRLAMRHILPNPAWMTLLNVGVWTYQRSGLQTLTRKFQLLNPFPALQHQESLLPRVPLRSALYPGMSFGNINGERVALMTGCVMDALYNPVHWATLDVLVANGYYVYIPEQTCCGALAHHAGEADIAQTLARKNIERVMRKRPDWVVLNAAGCGAALKEYPHILAEDPVYRQKAAEFSTKVVDIMELLDKKPLAPMPHRVEKTVTYHAACHLHHAQGIQTEPIALLGQVPGLKLVPLRDAESCCGSAGIYNLEQPELSEAILATKMEHLGRTEAEIVVTGNPGCMLQLDHGIRQARLSMQVQHPIEILALAYGKSEGRH
jgi:glycolate oxidase iron-sulfur subunit